MKNHLMFQILLVKEVLYDAESVLVMSVGNSSDGWVFVSACTFYNFPNRSWYDTFKVGNTIILLGDNIKDFLLLV
jgi:hypothetical protein